MNEIKNKIENNRNEIKSDIKKLKKMSDISTNFQKEEQVSYDV